MMLLYDGIKTTDYGFQSSSFTIFELLDIPWKGTLRIESHFRIYNTKH